MKFNYKEAGLYSIILILIYYIFTFVSQLSSGSNQFPSRLSYLFGHYYILFIILAIASMVSIFWKYKYNWVVISLPFFYILLNYFLNGLISIASFIRDASFCLFAIFYLFIKGIKDIKNWTYEITFAIIIFVLFIIKFFI
jgi:hypothetical protein